MNTTVYWRPGCGFCARLFHDLDAAGHTYERINIWDDPAAAEFVRSVANGSEIVPTVSVGGRSMVNPSARDVLTASRPKPAIRAEWNGEVIAESTETVMVEGNHYFPPAAVRADLLRPSTTHTVCSWKGMASYYTLHVNREDNTDAAWFYPEPKSAASNITGYIAFWRGVTVTSVDG